jgi:hypothetical protein
MGVAVSALWLDGKRLALDSQWLGAGWHKRESLPGGASWRWTEGNAAIVLPAGKGPRVLDVAVGMSERYWRDEVRAAG